jgi:hypothetical protein
MGKFAVLFSGIVNQFNSWLLVSEFHAQQILEDFSMARGGGGHLLEHVPSSRIRSTFSFCTHLHCGLVFGQKDSFTIWDHICCMDLVIMILLAKNCLFTDHMCKGKTDHVLPLLQLPSNFVNSVSVT